jgi:glycosyltransferase involved in cell wall biosynthesis
MKILLMSDAWAPQINGVVRTLQTVTQQLNAMGHTVLVIHPGLFPTVPCPGYKEIRLALVCPPKLAALIQAFSPEAIHIATEGPLGWAGRRYCVRHALPFTTGFHTRFPEYLRAKMGIPLSISYALLRYFHRDSKAILVPTQGMANHLKSQGFLRLKVWGRGVDTDIFRPQRPKKNPYPRPVMLNVGRVSVEKNLEAFLNTTVKGTKIVVGDGPQLAQYKRNYPNVIFMGAKQGKALVDCYNLADVFVFPSQSDTFGLVMLEALACGVSVAAYPVTGPVDVLTDAKVAFLDHDLNHAIVQALKLKPDHCRAFALKHSWQKIAEQFYTHLVPIKP